METESSRFSNIEIDDSPADKPASKMTVQELYNELAAPAAPTVPAMPLANTPPAILPRAQRPIASVPTSGETARSLRDDLIAVALPSEVTGAITYWRLAGSVDLTKLAAAWSAEGLDAKALPETPSPEVALHRAVKEQATKHRLVRQHPKGGWVIVDEKSAGGNLAYEVGVRVRLNQTKDGFLVTPPAGADAGAVQYLGQQIRAAFDRVRNEVASVDVSTWLVWYVARRLKGVALKDTGGIYFVPRAHAEELQKVKRALTAATSHKVFEIPALKSSETLEAVIDAVRSEAEKAAADLEQELEAGDLGKRALLGRVTRCNEAADKVRSYEKLLGRPLGDLIERINKARDRAKEASSRTRNLEVD